MHGLLVFFLRPSHTRGISTAIACLILLGIPAIAILGPTSAAQASEAKDSSQIFQAEDFLLFKQTEWDAGKDEEKIQREGRFLVGTDGTIDLPKVGKFPVAGKSVQEIKTELSPIFGASADSRFIYIGARREKKDASRHVDISGCVGFPGKLQWFPGLTVGTAIELCGGPMYSADTKTLMLKRLSTMSKLNFHLAKDRSTPLEPGDALYVPPHFF